MGFKDLGKKLSKLGQDTKNGVQKVSDSVSISNKLSAEKKSLGRLFATIGEAVYKESPDAPKPGLEDEWAAVKVAYANIASLNEQLDHVKGIIYCPNCGRPAAQGDKFCARCGHRLIPEEESTWQKMAHDIKDAGKEAGAIATDAADKSGEAAGGAAAQARNAFVKLKKNASKLVKDTEEKLKKAPKTAEDAEPEETAGLSADGGETVSDAVKEDLENRAQAAQAMEAPKEAVAEALEEERENREESAEAMEEPKEAVAEALEEESENREESAEAMAEPKESAGETIQEAGVNVPDPTDPQFDPQDAAAPEAEAAQEIQAAEDAEPTSGANPF